jgi:hypothetical protein
MDEAIKIDTVKSIVEDMDKTMNRDDLSDTARDALVIGYSGMLHKAYSKIQFVWLHLYELRAVVDELDDLEAALPKEVPTIDKDEEVTEDDLPFVTPNKEVEV